MINYKKIILLGLIFVICTYAYSVPPATPYRVKAIVTSGGVFQTGQTVYFAVQRNTDHYWYDFNDETFKASGWTTQNATMSDDITNPKMKYYYYDWTPPSGESANQIYSFFAATEAGIRMYDVIDLSYEQITFYFGQ